MTDKFLNSYHFVPTIEGTAGIGDGSLGIEHARSGEFGFTKDTAADGHAIYAENTFSGRIVCKLTTKTPLVVGAAREQAEQGSGNYNRIDYFKFRDRPAIPATSLKGMISSISEAVSGSAMRVLTPSPVIFRRKADRGLHALGLLEKARSGDWTIVPLTAPLILREFKDRRSNTYHPFTVREAKWKRVFDKYVDLKRYVGNRGVPPTVIDEDGERWTLPDLLSAKHASAPKHSLSFFYAKYKAPAENLDGLIRSIQQSVDNNTGSFRLKNDRFVLERRSTLHELWLKPPKGEEHLYTRGFLRYLELPTRDLPNTRKHEIFIPFPKEMNSLINQQKLVVSSKAMSRFKVLLAERWHGEYYEAKQGTPNKEQKTSDTRLPFAPIDVSTGAPMSWFKVMDSKADADRLPLDFDKWEPQSGLIVYFDVNDEKCPRVTELSLSAIWRDVARKSDGGAATTADFFEQSFGPDILPMHSERKAITPAERLFGFVTVDKHATTKEDRSVGAALAGRVRFSHATSKDDDLLGNEVTLKELANPKPPSPALYFRTRDGRRGVKKDETEKGLSIDRALPQGRKFYLHQDAKGEPWKAAPSTADGSADTGSHRKSKVRPIREGKEFWFHIDVDNLRAEELQLLCLSLKPSPRFWHKLGHGKAVGLGSIEIEPVAFLEVQRAARYSPNENGLFAAARYVCHGDLDAWPGKASIAATIVPADTNSTLSPRQLAREGKRAWGGEERFYKAISALLMIGEYHSEAATTKVVQTPLTIEKFKNIGTKSCEENTYEWFVANEQDRSDPQYLRPLDVVNKLEDGFLSPNIPPRK